jgi:uncharacterized protein involved in high-affinity Fe2+ transport
MRMFRLSILSLSAAFLSGGVSAALALEYPIGEPQLLHGMEIAAVYLQPIEMEPAGMMLPAAEADVHLVSGISTDGTKSA